MLSCLFAADSDDSDNEGDMGNVNRAVMRPPGHSGKAKRGHLCFDASFETGRLGNSNDRCVQRLFVLLI